MKFTLSWLKDFLDTESSLEKIVTTLTDIGLEIEEVIDRSKDLSGFIVAEIIEATKHPEADKLRLCKVNNGKEILNIVCGAPNARAGIKVVLAPVGITIPANGMVIKASKIRGHESNGMLCSAAELSLSEESEGIIELDASCKVGAEFLTECGHNDPVIDISITPNRGDCLGVYGIARDLAAAGLGTLKPIDLTDVKSSFKSEMKVSTYDNSQFVGRSFRNVKNVESPKWLQDRLRKIGSKPISAIVDITNYINLSFNKPLHAYDESLLGKELRVEKLKSDTKFTALNDQTYDLHAEDIIVSDERGEIKALAGIIGGANSIVSRETISVFLESAIFDAVQLSKTAKRCNVSTDSSFRFERNIDPEFVKKGAILASKMILDICGGEASELVIYGETPKVRTMEFETSRFTKLTGLEMSKDEMVSILQKLGFEIVDKGEILNLTIPTWRNDISMNADIVEELIRIKGFDELDITPLPKVEKVTIDPYWLRRNKAKRALAVNGLTEVFSFSFMSKQKAAMFHPNDESLELLNPLSVELDYMRQTIIPNLLDAIAKNSARNIQDLGLFEIGPNFVTGMPNSQNFVISIIRSGKDANRNIHNKPRDVDYYDIKQDIELLFEAIGFKFEKLQLDDQIPSWYHPKKAAALKMGKEIIAYFGEIHPQILHKFDIKQRVVAAEIFIDKLPLTKKKTDKYESSDYQMVSRDFAFITSNDVPAAKFIKLIENCDKNLIKSVSLFDIYSGDKIEQNHKSLAFNVQIQANDRTLTEQEIESLCNNIIKAVTNNLNAKLRLA